MRTTIVGIAVAVALLAATANAHAGPILVSLYPGTTGVTLTNVQQQGNSSFTVSLLFSQSNEALLLLKGLRGNDKDVAFSVNATNQSGQSWNSLSFEILDPKNGDDKADPTPYPSYVPAGWTTSNEGDGFSFAQGRNLPRHSDSFNSVFADEQTNARDLLTFKDGIVRTGATANFWMGLRDYWGNRLFVVRVDPTPTPEPASLLLLGTGMGALVRRQMRRRQDMK